MRTSNRCKRVVRSSMACEAAAAQGFEHGDYVRALFAEMVVDKFSVAEWLAWSSKWRLFLVLDAKTAFDTLSSDVLPQDRRAALDLAALREALKDPLHGSFCRWVPGPMQVADGLTMWAANVSLAELMEERAWSLVEDGAGGAGGGGFVAQRAHQRSLQRECKARKKLRVQAELAEQKLQVQAELAEQKGATQLLDAEP